jgi:menaquinone-dependent protoporphyrinogen IX oxidase
MKTLILYKSKYGCSKQYAQWLSLEIKSDIYELDQYQSLGPSLENYGLIILGGGIYFGKINGADFVSTNWDILKNKKVILFSTSGAEPGEATINKFYENSLPQEIRSKIRYFPLSGACEYKDLSILHKILVFIVSLFLKNPQKKQDLRYGLNRAIRENVNPILEYIRASLLSNVMIP